ncbi:unnamed protein product [Owenia fusiformis]|uniref:DNA repair protein complementing XP-C cells homolog n=1 Tax=Owenia fusiformis TaxID=6347 RepID=A0A8S4NP92_OWEFU|nr:unnamed protein product [Owenia fusiformis]
MSSTRHSRRLKREANSPLPEPNHHKKLPRGDDLPSVPSRGSKPKPSSTTTKSSKPQATDPPAIKSKHFLKGSKIKSNTSHDEVDSGCNINADHIKDNSWSKVNTVESKMSPSSKLSSLKRNESFHEPARSKHSSKKLFPSGTKVENSATTCTTDRVNKTDARSRSKKCNTRKGKPEKVSKYFKDGASDDDFDSFNKTTKSKLKSNQEQKSKGTTKISKNKKSNSVNQKSDILTKSTSDKQTIDQHRTNENLSKSLVKTNVKSEKHNHLKPEKRKIDVKNTKNSQVKVKPDKHMKPKIKKDNPESPKSHKNQLEKSSVKKEYVVPHSSAKFDASDVMSVLLHHEMGGMYSQSQSSENSSQMSRGFSSASCSQTDTTETESQDDIEEMDSDEDSDSDTWEDVKDIASLHGSPVKSQPEVKGVEITLQGPDIMNKRKKKKFDLQLYLKRKWNRFHKELQIDIHKAHLLCLIANGLYRNRMCNEPSLHAIALSVIPNNVPWQRGSTCNLSQCIKWFMTTFTVKQGHTINSKDLLDYLIAKGFESKVVSSKIDLVHLFVIFLRSLGFEVRLVLSLQPLPWKNTKNKSPTRKPKSDKQTISKQGSTKKNNTSKSDSASETCKPTKKSKPSKKQEKSREHKPLLTKNKQPRKCASKSKPIVEVDSDADLSSDSGDERSSKRKKVAKKRVHKDAVQDTNSDSEFEEMEKNFRISPVAVTKKPSSKPEKIISSDSENSLNGVNGKTGTDVWLEVYIESERKWKCIDCFHGDIGRPEKMEERATKPVVYVIGIDNDSKIKDLSQKYATNWMSHTRKLCVSEEWWVETLEPFKPTNKSRDNAEDNIIRMNFVKQPLPTSIGEFKNHPLYALKRHLLKFEAIYPESSVPVGFIRGEPVYARECVHQLHAREAWIKEARSVRVGEVPYKMVKKRVNPRKRASILDNGEDTPELPLYGLWQTEEYMPPPAFDGKVPKNEYGNVEMFKPSMLPIGTVHLRLANLNKIAKKLDIDIAAAMTGWDFHGGWSHPILDGWIVCEEHKDILLAAWDEQQEIEREKERKKRQDRVLKNWKLLIKGMLIKEKLKKRFDLEEKDPTNDQSPTKTSDTSKSKPGAKPPSGETQEATDAQKSWPRNIMREKEKSVNKKKTSKVDQSHLFPFEKM